MKEKILTNFMKKEKRCTGMLASLENGKRRFFTNTWAS
jgi:hypothetical protein